MSQRARPSSYPLLPIAAHIQHCEHVVSVDRQRAERVPGGVKEDKF